MTSGVPGRQSSAAVPRRFGRASALACFGFATRFALLVWAVDVFRIVRADLAANHAPWRALAAGLLAALFRGLLVSLCGAACVALLLLLSAVRRGFTHQPAWRWRVRGYLLDGSAQEQLVRAGTLLAVLPLMAAVGSGMFVLGQRLIVGMARPEFALLALVLFVPLAGLGTLLASRLALMPHVGPRCFARTVHYAAWLALLVAIASGLFVHHYRAPLAYLPWPVIGQLLGALLVAALVQRPFARLPRWTRRPLRGLALGLLAGAAICAQLQSPTAVLPRQIAERETLSGRIGQAALLWLWDRDHDGYLPFLGGGDCAANDPTRNPAATDVPGNGIDEDCDGSDLDLRAAAVRGRSDFPVPAQVPRRPPIILITVDAFAASHMRALGYSRALTSHIDAFATRSVFFRDCFAQGPSTRLSFPAIFTSRWDTQIEQQLTGRHPFPISPHETLLAQTLDAAGYDTSAVLPDPYFSPRFWQGITRGFAHVIESPFTTEPALAHNGGRVTDAAIAELTRERSKPLFLWVHYYDAHSPHEQPDGVPAYGKTRADLYDAELNFVDREVGRLLEAIDKQFAGQALVVLTGDHGVAFDEPRHATFNYGYDLYTAVLHVPLIVHAPFLSARTLDSVVSTMDIVPTLANLLRLPGPFRYEGTSLVPELFTGKPSRPPELMHQMFLEERLWKEQDPLERVSLRTNEFDLLQDRKTGFFELYAFRKDYFETHDLALDPVYGAQLAALRKQLTILLYSARPRPRPNEEPHRP
jgi:arylsulfatase A-like enzyme